MNIKSWKLELTWEDGTVNDVSCYVPAYTIKAIEYFCDYWEEKYNDDLPHDICSVCDESFESKTLVSVNDESFDLICNKCLNKGARNE